MCEWPLRSQSFLNELGLCLISIYLKSDQMDQKVAGLLVSAH